MYNSDKMSWGSNAWRSVMSNPNRVRPVQIMEWLQSELRDDPIK